MENGNNNGQDNYGSYPVNPDDNSYSYTGSSGDGGTARSDYGSQSGTYGSFSEAASAMNNGSHGSYSDAANGAGAYSSYSSYSDASAGGGSYSSYTDARQAGDRYYSPYERRTVEEGGKKKRRKREKKQHGFGMTIAKCACLAAVFGLVAGGIFSGIYYLLPAKEQPAAPSEKTPALTTTSGSDNNTEVGAYDTGARDVSGIAEEAMPSIVAITNMSQQEFMTWFGQSYTQESDSAGSGIIVSEDDEYLYIATNNHVVAGADELTVQFCDDSTVSAEVRGASPSNDLAVVKVKLEDVDPETMDAIHVARINSEGKEKVGQPVIAIGNALGYGQSVTTGIISALDREISAQDSTTGETYTNTLTQTDASINPGNSGGALLNMNGEVIGINSSKIGGEDIDGVGFAIPMTTAASIIDDLITRQAVDEDKAGYLGVAGKDVDEAVSEAYSLPTGVFVTKVYRGSAAEAAGIQRGDIITKFEGHDIESMNEIKELLQYREAGTEVKVVICRADNGSYVEHELSVTLGSKN